ncbi:hypothetical protein M3Y94_00899600 [Aphelenchoides besseyi]|nr:hypothetical protein M3Y94_00899600 [Aphelenchoides besseyi]
MFYRVVLFALFSWISNSKPVDDASTMSMGYEINGNTIFCVSDSSLVAAAQIRLYRNDLEPGRNLIKTIKPHRNGRYHFKGMLEITEDFDVKKMPLFWLSIEHTCGGRPYLLVINLKSFNKPITLPYIILDSIEPTSDQYFDFFARKPKLNFKNLIRGYDQNEEQLPEVIRESMDNEQ